MVTNSNLYAEKIFSEHPLALWPLDDNITFLQLFPDSRQNLGNEEDWEVTNLTQIEPSDYPDTPIPSSNSSSFIKSSSASNSSIITSTFTLNSSADFNNSRGTACFSAHAYGVSVFIESFEIGVIYDGVEYFSEYKLESTLRWQKISHTFELPFNSDITFFIRTIYLDLPVPLFEFKTQFNGVSLGQWSENFSTLTSGFNEQDLPDNLQHLLNSGSAYTSVTMDSYGTDTEMNGYYVVKNNKIFVENSGIPMVFGSNHTTRILEAPDNNPSIIFPGSGFLNNSGKYNNYTLEAWIRIDNVSANPIKIIGPVKSNDGIYVEEGFITIKIGYYSKSYFVGKWYRPMLIHFKYSETEAVLLINGEQVITMPFDLNNVTFLEKFSPELLDQDWIGVYGSSLIYPFEIDCLSITPYLIPLEIAKRRFVYGQGVAENNNSNETLSTKSTFFDYSFSGYATNVLYPDLTSWRSGYSNNLNTTSTYMTTPNYDLPEVQLKRNSKLILTDKWFEENKNVNNNDLEDYAYFLMKPFSENIAASATFSQIEQDVFYSDPTIYYDSLRVISDKLSSVCGVFKSPVSGVSNQKIMVFKNKTNNEQIEITLNLDSLTYNHISSSGTSTVLKTETVESGEYFVAGISLDQIQSKKHSIIGNFFSSLNAISLNVGGYFESSFLGKIFAIHFNNEFFFEKDLNNFFEDGFIKQVFESESVPERLIDYTANYSLIPIKEDNVIVLDIGVTGYWEDIQPLSFFGKYITNIKNEPYYDLDMLQFNIDSPKRRMDEHRYIKLPPGPKQLTYGGVSKIYKKNRDISNVLLGGYESYGETKMDGEIIDTNIISYISFQKYTDAGKKPYKDFTNTAILSSNNVVSFNSSEYENTRYPVVDNTIIFPPKIPDFKEYYLGIHLEITVRGINKKNMFLKRMEISSLAFDDQSPYEIGTKYANSVYPFSREKYLFDYKQKNPITIYKDSSPYLYLTEYSGIYANIFDSSYVRGTIVPLNKNKEEEYYINGIQFWSRSPLKVFPMTPFVIAKIKTETSDVDLYLEPVDFGKRAFLKSYDYSTGEELKDLEFYQDGQKINYPVIYPRQWSSIALGFLNPIICNSFTGRLELYSGLVFNNIVEYNYANFLLNTNKRIEKKWFQVYVDDSLDPYEVNSWQDVYDEVGELGESSWKVSTYELVPDQRTINGEYEYNSQLGISVSVTDDISSLSIYSNGSDVFTDVKWKTFEVSSF